jgi:nicotinate-nucleotide adenylyltransferase
VHNGHLHLAHTALDVLGLAGVRWIPSGRPGHRAPPVASDAQRLAMLELALAGDPRHEIDTAELRSVQPTYTIQTVQRLRAAEGEARPLVFLIGADQLMALDTWREWQSLLAQTHFAVAARPGHDIDAARMSPALAEAYRARAAAPPELASSPAGLICVFPIAPLAVSSSGVRAALAAGRAPRDLLPHRVLDYIESAALYRAPAGRPARP